MMIIFRRRNKIRQQNWEWATGNLDVSGRKFQLEDKASEFLWEGGIWTERALDAKWAPSVEYWRGGAF